MPFRRRALDRLYTSIPADDCKTEWVAVVVDLAGNQTEIGRYDTEEEADEAAESAAAHDLDDNGQFGVGA